MTVSSASFTEDIFANLRKKATSPKGMLHLNQALALAVVFSLAFPEKKRASAPAGRLGRLGWLDSPIRTP